MHADGQSIMTDHSDVDIETIGAKRRAKRKKKRTAIREAEEAPEDPTWLVQEDGTDIPVQSRHSSHVGKKLTEAQRFESTIGSQDGHTPKELREFPKETTTPSPQNTTRSAPESLAMDFSVASTASEAELCRWDEQVHPTQEEESHLCNVGTIGLQHTLTNDWTRDPKLPTTTAPRRMKSKGVLQLGDALGNAVDFTEPAFATTIPTTSDQSVEPPPLPKRTGKRKKASASQQRPMVEDPEARVSAIADWETACGNLESELQEQKADLDARRQALADAETAHAQKVAALTEKIQKFESHMQAEGDLNKIRQREVTEKEAVLKHAVEKFEAREKALREKEQREGLVAERERSLRDKLSFLALREEQSLLKEKEVDEKQRELHSMQAKLNEAQKDIEMKFQRLQEEQIQLSKDSENLAEKAAATAVKDAEAQQLQQKAQAQLLDLEKRNVLLTSNEENFRARDQQLRLMEQELDRKLENVNARLAELDLRDEQLSDMEYQVQQRETSLEEAQKQIETQSKETKQLAEDIAEKEQALSAEKEQLQEEQQQLRYDLDAMAEREEELQRKEARAQELWEQIQAKEVALERLENEMQQRETKLEELEASVASESARLVEWEESMTTRERRLQEQEARQAQDKKKLVAQEQALEVAEKDLQQREATVSARHADIVDRETATKQLESTLESRMSELAKAENKLMDEKNQMAIREKKLNIWEGNLTTKQEEFVSRSRHLQQQVDKVKELEETSNRRMTKAKALDSQVRKLQGQLKEREAEIEAWKSTLSKREVELEEREEALKSNGLKHDARLRELQQYETELQEREAQLREQSNDVLEREAIVLKNQEKFDQTWPEVMRKKEELHAREVELVQWMKEMEWREKMLEEMEVHPYVEGSPKQRKQLKRSVEGNPAFGQALLSVQLKRLQQSYVVKAQQRGYDRMAMPTKQRQQDNMFSEAQGLAIVSDLDANIKAKVGYIRRMWAKTKMWEAEQEPGDAEFGPCRIFTGTQRREIKLALEKEGILRAEDEFLREFSTCPIERRMHFSSDTDFHNAIEMWWSHVKAKVLERIVSLVETRLQLMEEAVEILDAKKDAYPELFQDRLQRREADHDVAGPVLNYKTTKYVSGQKVKAEPLFKVRQRKTQNALQQFTKDVATHSIVPDMSAVPARYQMYGNNKPKDSKKATRNTAPGLSSTAQNKDSRLDSDEVVSDHSQASSVADYLDAALTQDLLKKPSGKPRPQRRACTGGNRPRPPIGKEQVKQPATAEPRVRGGHSHPRDQKPPLPPHLPSSHAPTSLHPTVPPAKRAFEVVGQQEAAPPSPIVSRSHSFPNSEASNSSADSVHSSSEHTSEYSSDTYSEHSSRSSSSGRQSSATA